MIQALLTKKKEHFYMSKILGAKLGAMMFLQFMLVAVFFPQLAQYLANIKVGGYMMATIMATMAWGSLLSPIVGMLADRVMNAEKVLCVLNALVAVLLFLAAGTENHTLLFVYLLAAMAAYMPTWGLTSSIALAHSSAEAFPVIRVFGSIGWMCAAGFALAGKWCFGAYIDGTNIPLYCGAGVAAAAAAFAPLLPKTAPAAKGQPVSIADTLGLSALSMLKDKNVAVCIFCSCAWMFAFVIYWLFFSQFLAGGLGVKDITLTMSVGQISEMLFMVLLPLSIRFFGLKISMCIGLAAMVARYVMCAFAPDVFGLHLGAIALHGIVFGFFFVAVQIYIAKKAPKQLQAQAQGMLFFIVMGAAQVIGAYFTRWLVGAYTSSVQAAEAVDWKSIFLVEAAATLAVFVVFALFFKDDTQKK